MLGIEKSKTNPNDFFRDESEPRPPPRFPALPVFDMEPPKPTVPDVSLFFPSPIMAGSNNHHSFGLDPGLSSCPYGSTPTSAKSASASALALSHNNSQQMSILNKGQTPPTPQECSYGYGYGTPNGRMMSAATFPGQNSRSSSNSHLHSSNSISPHTSTPVMTGAAALPTSPSLDNSLLQQLVDLVKKQSVAPPLPAPAVDNGLLQQMIGIVKNQSTAIEKMQEQLDTLTAAVTATAQSQSRRSSSSGSRCPTPTVATASKEVQVNLQQFPESRKQSPRQVVTKVPTANFGCQTEKEKEPNGRERENERSIVSVESTSGDVSRFLRDVSLRLPQIEENTVYSADTSAIRHIDMPEYDSSDEEDEEEDVGQGHLKSDSNGNPHNGPGIFAFASSSEDENGLGERVVKPTEMFYHRNALENRSRYAAAAADPEDETPRPERKRSVPVDISISPMDNSLIEERGRGPSRPTRRTAAPSSASRDRSSSTDSTLYGLSSKHLSFSTKQYLQRYGLVHSGGTGQPAPSPKFLFGENGNGNGNGSPAASPSASDRILDITAIKNQPKLS